MPTFDPSTDLGQDLDFRLLSDGPVSLFWQEAGLIEVCDWFPSRGYAVVSLRATDWHSELDAHVAIAAALDFPGYYSGNLDALNDCLSDVAEAEYGLRPEDTGLVVVMVGYDTFARRVPAVAQAVVDIFARQSRTALFFGNRLLCLVQANDPRFTLAPVGASPVMWNPVEWLNSSRGL